MKRNNWLFMIPLLIIVLWISSWLIIDYVIFPKNVCDNDIYAKRGTFGDKFGFINSLFSALALIGVVVSTYLQKEELNDTKKEFEQQNFQTTFFNLLKNQREIATEIESTFWELVNYEKEQVYNIKGKEFFISSKISLTSIVNVLNSKRYGNYKEWQEHLFSDEMNFPHSPESAEITTNYAKKLFTIYNYSIEKNIVENNYNENSIEIFTKAYTIFFHKYNYVIGQYFRHLFHILKFLDTNSKTKIDPQEYAGFIQAQMSIPELFLLYYNCLIFPKMKELIIRFNLLENLYEQDLINKIHIQTDIKLKSR